MKRPIVVVTGASGWLGRETISTILKSKQLSSNFDLKLFASKDKIIEINENQLSVKSLNDIYELESAEVLGVIHLGFLTRDKVKLFTPDQYVFQNISISSTIASFIRKSSPKWIITVSSGAVLNRSNQIEFDVQDNPYGFCKNLEELLITEAAKEVKANVVIGRLWGATGSEMPLNANYAVSDFIQSALIHSHIQIKSGNPVHRRYVNASEFMTLLIREANNGNQIVLNSGGPLIEIGQLAKEISDQIAGVTVSREDPKSELEDTYFPKTSEYEELCAKYGEKPMRFGDQVKLTIQNHRRLLIKQANKSGYEYK